MGEVMERGGRVQGWKIGGVEDHSLRGDGHISVIWEEDRWMVVEGSLRVVLYLRVCHKAVRKVVVQTGSPRVVLYIT